MPLSNTQLRRLIEHGDLQGVQDQDIMYASILLRAGFVMHQGRKVSFQREFGGELKNLPIVCMPQQRIMIVTQQHVHLNARFVGTIRSIHSLAELNVIVDGAPLMGGHNGHILMQLSTHDMPIDLEFGGVVAQLFVDEVDGDIAWTPPPDPPKSEPQRRLVANMRVQYHLDSGEVF